MAPKAHYLLHNSPPLVPVLRQMCITRSLPFRVHLNVILPSYPKSYKLPLSFRNRMRFPSLPHACHMLRPLTLFDLITAHQPAAYCHYCHHQYQKYYHCCCSHYWRKSHSMALRPQICDRRSAAWYIPCVLFGTGRALHVFLKDQSVQEELTAWPLRWRALGS